MDLYINYAAFTIQCNPSIRTFEPYHSFFEIHFCDRNDLSFNRSDAKTCAAIWVNNFIIPSNPFPGFRRENPSTRMRDCEQVSAACVKANSD